MHSLKNNLKIIGMFAFLWKLLSQHHDPSSLTLQVLLLPYSLPGCIIDLFAFCVTDELKTSYNLGSWNILSSLSHNLPLFWKSCKGLRYLDMVNISLSSFSSSCVWYYLQPTLEKQSNNFAYLHCTCFCIDCDLEL